MRHVLLATMQRGPTAGPPRGGRKSMRMPALLAAAVVAMAVPLLM
jgi:hypothetical protein